MQFQGLTDKQLDMMKQHVPKPSHTGRPRSNDRKIISGILFVAITGCRWNQMPKKYGFKSTANRRLNSWQQKGIWKKALSCVIRTAHKSNKLNLQKISADSPSVSAKKKGDVTGYDGFKRITGTKIYVAAEQNSLPNQL